jgi:hypothetical protein
MPVSNRYPDEEDDEQCRQNRPLDNVRFLYMTISTIRPMPFNDPSSSPTVVYHHGIFPSALRGWSFGSSKICLVIIISCIYPVTERGLVDDSCRCDVGNLSEESTRGI